MRPCGERELTFIAGQAMFAYLQSDEERLWALGEQAQASTSELSLSLYVLSP